MMAVAIPAAIKAPARHFCLPLRSGMESSFSPTNGGIRVRDLAVEILQVLVGTTVSAPKK